MCGADQPCAAVQVTVRIWSVCVFVDASEGRGMGSGFWDNEVISLDASRGDRLLISPPAVFVTGGRCVNPLIGFPFGATMFVG